MSYNITFSTKHEELRKEAEDFLNGEQRWCTDGYTFEIVLVPTAVVFNEEGRACRVLNPDTHLIRKEIKS